MKNFLRYSIIVAALLPQLKMSAQNEADALRYSFYDLPVSARSLGMGGAFGGIGADISNFYSNPGGLGMYKRGSMELSFGLHDNATETSYMNQNADNARSRFNLNGIGLVGSAKSQDSDWKAINFGIAYSKTNNFYENISIRGKAFSSILQPFSLQADGTLPDAVTDNFPYTAGLAYQTYAINPTDSTGQFYAPAADGLADQAKNVNRTGSQGETAFGFGANYKDFLSFGFSINFLGLTFTERSTYTELYSADEQLTSLTLNENLRTDGTGVNARFGAIVRPSKWLRAGVAYHTPMRITLHDLYSATMKTKVDGTSYEYSSPDLVTDYSVRSPSRLMANAAFILGKFGIVSADYEYTNFDRIRMNGSATNSYDYSSENNTIKSIYRSTHKVRAGFELRVHNSVYLRGGAVYQQNPLSTESGEDAPALITYTGGVGYRNDYFFADLGISFTERSSSYYLYDPRFVEAADISQRYTRGILSIGTKF